MKGAFIFGLLVLLSSGVMAQGYGFDVSTPVIKSVVRIGEEVNVPVSVINGRNLQRFEISYHSEKDFMAIDDTYFILDEKEDHGFKAILNSKNLIPGFYSGEILIKGETGDYYIPVLFEVESSDVLIDVSSDKDSRNSEVSPGSDFITSVRIYNINSETGIANINYFIKDLWGNLIVSERQAITVGNQIEVEKTFHLPDALDEGKYVFFVTIVSGNSVGVTSFLFDVSDQARFSPAVDIGKIQQYPFFIAGLIIISLVFAFFAFNHLWAKRLVRSSKEFNKRITDIRNIKFSDAARKARKLEYQKNLLEESYNRGYITQSSYYEGRAKINEIIKKLKKRL